MTGPAVTEHVVTVEQVRAIAARARDAAADLAPMNRAVKDAALRAMAAALIEATDAVMTANGRDIAAGRASGLSESMIDRLALNPDRVAAMAQGMLDVA